MQANEEKFELFALVELFGHQKIAGKITEKIVAGQSFLHVEVPATQNNVGFSRLIAPSAVYAINPITEELMKTFAENIRSSPVQPWDIDQYVKAAQNRAAAALHPATYSDEQDSAIS